MEPVAGPSGYCSAGPSAIPAGYEECHRDYFESDDEDESPSVVYPDSIRQITSNGTPQFDHIATDDFKEAKDDSPPRTMYLTELENFLTELDLEEYIGFFKQQRISYHDLLSFNESDLDALDELGHGIKLRIWEGIKKEHGEAWQSSETSYLDRKAHLDCSEVVILLKKIDFHLKKMQLTFEYLRNRFKKDQDMTLRWTKYTSMNDVHDQSTETYNQGLSLMDTMKAFVQDVTCEEVIPNGHSKYHGEAAMKPEVKQKEPTPYKTVLVISGLFGLFTAITYLNRGSITSLFSRK